VARVLRAAKQVGAARVEHCTDKMFWQRRSYTGVPSRLKLARDG
jgi:hypothetical protein